MIDPQLLDFPVEVLPVMIHKKPYANRKLEFIRKQPFMHGVSVRRIKRAGIDIPVFAQTVVDSGDTLELVGLKKEVETAAKQLGYIDRPTNATDMVFVGIGILIGGVIGAFGHHIGRTSHQSQHKWRSTDCRSGIRMVAAVNTPHSDKFRNPLYGY